MLCSFHYGRLVSVTQQLPWCSVGKESAYNAGNLGSIPGLGRSSGEGSDAPPRCSCLKNPVDRGASYGTVHEVTMSSKAGPIWSCPTHCKHVDYSPAGSSILGILQTGILGWVAIPFSIYLQYRSPGFSPWGRKNPCRGIWLPTPVFLPGKSHGQRSLVGYSPWGCQRWTCSQNV